MTAWVIVIPVVIGYLLGSVPFSYIAGRLRGLDLREHGSGNLGASNTYRVLGAAYAIPVLILDIAKGAAAVLLAGWLCGKMGWEPIAWGRSAAATAAILGHIWTVFLGFRGGKGVATAAGAFFALAPVSTLVSVGVWLVLVAATRYVSVGSMIGAITLPVGIYFFGRAGGGRTGPEFWFSVAVAAVVLVGHRSNIRRLLAGHENRLARIRKESTT